MNIYLLQVRLCMNEYALTFIKHEIDQYSERGYIDRNGFLTDAVIHHRGEAGGFYRIKDELINLLHQHQDLSITIPMQLFSNEEDTIQEISKRYCTETGLEDIDVSQMTDDGGEFGIFEYRILLPLRYIVHTFIWSHERKYFYKPKDSLYYKTLSSNQLIELLNSDE